MIDKKNLKIVFFGTPEFAVESLARLVDEGFNVAAVVTMPDKPAGRGHKMFQSPVKLFALEHDIPVLQPVKLKDEEFLSQLRSIGANLFVVIAFRMLPAVVWQMPPLGTFNLHASLLPLYRGAAPINWPIINGDTVTGVTTFFLKQDIDTGDIIDREQIAIEPEDNVGTLHDKLMHLGSELTLRTVKAICEGKITTIPQDSIADVKPTAAPKIFKDTCRIDWSRTATELHNFVRGLSPYPAAWTELTAENAAPMQVKVFTTEVKDTETAGTPGKIIEGADGSITVECGRGRLAILSLQAEGKRRMDTADFTRGRRLSEPRFK